MNDNKETKTILHLLSWKSSSESIRSATEENWIVESLIELYKRRERELAVRRD